MKQLRRTVNLIKPKVEILEPTGYDLVNILKDIEKFGRVCYKPEDAMSEDSYRHFVDRIIKKHHTAMLEHGTIYLKTSRYDGIVYKYMDNEYSEVIFENKEYYITTNYRVIIENGWEEDLQYLCEPTEHHEKRITVKFICDIGVSHRLVRHRTFSFAQESTRYVNCTKLGRTTYVIPEKLNYLKAGEYSMDLFDETVYRNGRDIFPPTIAAEDFNQYEDVLDFVKTCIAGDREYGRRLARGWTSQDARSGLPIWVKTEVIVSGFISDWVGEEVTGNNRAWGFFPLRANPTAHPDMRVLAYDLKNQFKEKGWL